MTDERDPKVSRRYRELGAEEPSRELDQAILSAAHRAADKPHAPLVTPAGAHRWYFAFGAAAILVLAVAVTVQVERQRPDPEAIAASPAPARSDQAEASASRQGEQKQAEQAAPPKPLSDAAKKPDRQVREFARDPSAPAAAPSATPESTEAARNEAARNEAARNEADTRARAVTRSAEVERAPAPQAAPLPQAGALEGRVASSALALSPERLLERIAELRKEGRHDEADKALAEFRQRYPDYRISEEMLQKVERKK
jgi:hypothetical protein